MLIMGLGAQMTVWPELLIQELVRRGHRVIQFDNRDVGLSSKLDQWGQPNPITHALKRKLKLNQKPPYTLEDMAQDVIELMDGLQIEKAHLVGASMGGMIAQIVAAQHKARCLSLTTLMSTSGNPKLPKANLRVLWQLISNRRPNTNEESAIAKAIALNRILSGSRFDIEEAELRSLAERNIKRCYHPAGFKRQLVAITSAQSRVPLLKRIKVPTLIIHGSEDPLIPVQAALDLAIHIPKSKIRIIRGMGHHLPPPVCPSLAKMIAKHTHKAERKWAQKQRQTQPYEKASSSMEVSIKTPNNASGSLH